MKQHYTLGTDVQQHHTPGTQCIRLTTHTQKYKCREAEYTNELYQKYAKEVEKQNKVIFGGRLGKYKYYDMHHVVDEALKCVKEELGDL